MCQNLLSIAKTYVREGEEFLKYLDTFALQRANGPGMLQSAKIGIKLKWENHRIESFSSKIDKFRNLLTLATILALRARTDSDNTKILENLSTLKTAGETHNTQNTQGIEALQTIMHAAQSQSRQDLDKVHAGVEKCLLQLERLRQQLSQTQEIAILKWLNFRQMKWRYEEVPLAYQKTFQWIFAPPSKEDGWHDFMAHLVGENVSFPYWINGKAGSGKSTLMKFIVKDPRTEDALKRWAGEKRLLAVNFFFWNLGTKLQKTNIGMLRALMHNVLAAYPELVPAVFPTLYQAWNSFDLSSEPSIIEVKSAFELLLEKASKFLKLAIFVDGIDEFEGDHKDVSLFLAALASAHVKVIVSSRPISACVSVFQRCPTLRLQDLTRRDMEIFVKENLSEHEKMTELTKRFPTQAHELTEEIKLKAAGVFLWVKLVVRLLVDGLEEGDDIKDLRARLKRLPPDLRDLYQRMISRMQPEHQRQAAELFRLFHTWNLCVSDQPLRTATLAFAIRPPLEAFEDVVAPIDPGNLQWLCSNTEARLRSRCCGLLEVHKKVTIPKATKERYLYGEYALAQAYSMSVDPIVTSTVDYLHRTVAEFILSDDVWNEICSMTADSNFGPTLHLACASLSMMKIDESYLRGDLNVHVTNALTFCRSATEVDGPMLAKLMTEIEVIMHQLRLRYRKNDSQDIIRSNMHWSETSFQRP